jgi:hypothetical protein
VRERGWGGWVCLCPGRRLLAALWMRGRVSIITNWKAVANRTGTQAMWIATFVGSRWYAPYCVVVLALHGCVGMRRGRTKTRFFLRSNRGIVVDAVRV